jgi:phosphoglycolate phosphatase
LYQFSYTPFYSFTARIQTSNGERSGVRLVTIRCGDQEFKDIQGIIFDKDGTLEDSRAYWHEVAIARIEAIESRVPGIANPLRLAFGLGEDSLNPAGLMAVGSRIENEIAAAAYITATGRDWGLSLQIARSSFQQADRLVPPRINPLYADCRAMIEELAKAGLSLAILSADTTARVRDFVKENGLEKWITVAVGSDRERSKPDPQLAIETCEKMGVAIKRVIMVGDSAGDMEMAKKAGAAGAIGIDWQGGEVRGAEVVISTLRAIVIVGE